jgi:hypothetical protein
MSTRPLSRNWTAHFQTLRDRISRMTAKQIISLWIGVLVLSLVSLIIDSRWAAFRAESRFAPPVGFYPYDFAQSAFTYRRFRLTMVFTRLFPLASSAITASWLLWSPAGPIWMWGPLRVALLWLALFIAAMSLPTIIALIDPCPGLLCFGVIAWNATDAAWLWLPCSLSLAVFTLLWIYRRRKMLW